MQVTIIQEIHAWSKGLPVWQQDAIARLYQDRTFNAADLDDLYALAKAEAGILDPDGRKPKKLEDAQIAPPADPARIVQLAAIDRELNWRPLLMVLPADHRSHMNGLDATPFVEFMTRHCSPARVINAMVKTSLTMNHIGRSIETGIPQRDRYGRELAIGTIMGSEPKLVARSSRNSPSYQARGRGLWMGQI